MYAYMKNALLAGLGAITIAAAAAPTPASAQIYFIDPVFERGPIEPNDPLIGTNLSGATPAEQRAGLIWSMRAALNVAALQCQFSRYLRAVDNYNAILQHHSGELTRAYTTLGSYFARRGGARGGRDRFDTWTTIAYNSFSTLDAQAGFCQTAAAIARDALSRPKGQFLQLARERMRELRASLTPVRDRLWVGPPPVLAALPASVFAAPDCTGLRGRELERCRAS